MRPITVIAAVIMACLFLHCAGSSKIAVDDTCHTAETISFEHAPSVINIPVEINISHIEQIISKQLSGVLYQNNAFAISGFGNIPVSIRRSGRVRAQARGNELRYEIPLKITMRFPFAEADAGVLLKMRSKFTLRNNWRIVTETTVEEYTWTSEPVVRVRSINLPVKSAADFLISRQLAVIIEKVDKEGISIKSLITPLWGALQTPLECVLPDTEQSV